MYVLFLLSFVFVELATLHLIPVILLQFLFITCFMRNKAARFYRFSEKICKFANAIIVCV